MAGTSTQWRQLALDQYAITTCHHQGWIDAEWKLVEGPMASFWNTLNVPAGPRRPLTDTNCKNCAAPLNWLKSKCEYCHTFFS